MFFFLFSPHLPEQHQVKMPPKTTPKQPNKKRGGNFTTLETMHFLTYALKVVPINRDEWQIVADEHALEYPECNRDVEGLRRKYNTLVKRSAPTGNPTIPSDACIAKELQNAIRYKCEVAVGDDAHNRNSNESRDDDDDSSGGRGCDDGDDSTNRNDDNNDNATLSDEDWSSYYTEDDRDFVIDDPPFDLWLLPKVEQEKHPHFIAEKETTKEGGVDNRTFIAIDIDDDKDCKTKDAVDVEAVMLKQDSQQSAESGELFIPPKFRDNSKQLTPNQIYPDRIKPPLCRSP